MVEKSGKIGENIYYIFDNITGTLTISGKGKIDYLKINSLFTISKARLCMLFIFCTQSI